MVTCNLRWINEFIMSHPKSWSFGACLWVKAINKGYNLAHQTYINKQGGWVSNSIPELLTSISFCALRARSRFRISMRVVKLLTLGTEIVKQGPFGCEMFGDLKDYDGLGRNRLCTFIISKIHFTPGTLLCCKEQQRKQKQHQQNKDSMTGSWPASCSLPSYCKSVGVSTLSAICPPSFSHTSLVLEAHKLVLLVEPSWKGLVPRSQR